MLIRTLAGVGALALIALAFVAGRATRDDPPAPKGAPALRVASERADVPALSRSKRLPALLDKDAAVRATVTATPDSGVADPTDGVTGPQPTPTQDGRQAVPPPPDDGLTPGGGDPE